MAKRYLNRKDAERCKADIVLRDGSTAQCQRYKITSGYCTQHWRMIYGARLSPATREDMRRGWEIL